MNTDTRDVLMAAMTEGTPIHLISVRAESRLLGQLLEITEDGLHLSVLAGEAPEPHDMVSGSFASGSKVHIFVAHVVEGPDEGLWLTLPRDTVSADRRRAPRTPVRLPVDVRLLGADPDCAPVLVDIALAGMRVKLAQPTQLALRDRLPVVLQFEEHHVELLAELRHEAGGSAGFSFPGMMRNDRPKTSAALQALVERIERG